MHARASVRSKLLFSLSQRSARHLCYARPDRVSPSLPSVRAQLSVRRAPCEGRRGLGCLYASPAFAFGAGGSSEHWRQPFARELKDIALLSGISGGTEKQRTPKRVRTEPAEHFRQLCRIVVACCETEIPQRRPSPLKAEIAVLRSATIAIVMQCRAGVGTPTDGSEGSRRRVANADGGPIL